MLLKMQSSQVSIFFRITVGKHGLFTLLLGKIATSF